MSAGLPIHFISGLPRSGSTLLAALLRQNPALHANITSPLGSMVKAMLGDMSADNESAVFFTPAQREAVLRGLFVNYYDALAPGCTVFDTNRGWTTRLDLLARLFPDFRMICCVRPVPWIIDSVERLIRNNPFELSKIFSFDAGGTVYSRAEGLMSGAGLIGFPLAALKQAMHAAEAGRLLLLPYDTLVSEPAAALDAIYAFTGVAPFRHDFENVSFDATEFDARLGTPGLHDVHPRVRPVERKTILPPDLWERYERTSIWRAPEFNTGGTPVAGDPPGVLDSVRAVSNPS
ncbi:MAG: sulfotransferase family protein [Janthinobacterium lividum]